MAVQNPSGPYWFHTGFNGCPPSLTSSVRSVASPSQCSGQIPIGTRQMGSPSMAERDAA